jgi:peptidyl-prolyl cis-trans isomerase SurA
MNKWFKLSLIGIFSLYMNGYSLGAAKTPAQPLDRIVAVVNKTIITQSELEEALHKIKQQLSATHTPLPPATILGQQVLDQLINRKLQLDLAEQAGIQVDNADVTKAINSIAHSNHITADRLYAEVSHQGLNKMEYRKEIQDEITINRIQQQMIGSKIVISPQEVDDFMRSAAWQSYSSKEYHLEDILIALPETPTPKDMTDAKNRAEAILAKLRKGTSFRAAAVSESGSSKALQGGDLGWRKLPEIPSAFASEIITMKNDAIAGPIQTPNGFHIIHIAGIRNVGMHGNKQEQTKQVQELLYQRKYEEALQSWTTKLRSEAFINTHLEN